MYCILSWTMVFVCIYLISSSLFRRSLYILHLLELWRSCSLSHLRVQQNKLFYLLELASTYKLFCLTLCQEEIWEVWTKNGKADFTFTDGTPVIHEKTGFKSAFNSEKMFLPSIASFCRESVLQILQPGSWNDVMEELIVTQFSSRLYH